MYSCTHITMYVLIYITIYVLYIYLSYFSESTGRDLEIYTRPSGKTSFSIQMLILFLIDAKRSSAFRGILYLKRKTLSVQ